jgi:hypothetical protein
MTTTMAKTLHVFPSDGAWAVKTNGHSVGTFDTQREAVATAQRSLKKAGAAQIVVHGKDGRILKHQTHGMPKIQEPPRKGRLASKKIATAVGKVVLHRLQSGRERTSEE